MGKSTLLNALVGQKISITSSKAQTTRHRITGVRTAGQTQFIFVDTGLQTKHGSALNRSLNRGHRRNRDVDLVLFVVEAGNFTLGDAKVLSAAEAGNPGDPGGQQAGHAAPARRPGALAARHAGAPSFADIHADPAKERQGHRARDAGCGKYLPQSAWFYGRGRTHGQEASASWPARWSAKSVPLTGDELPYTSTVVIDEFKEEPSPKFKRMVRIAATIVVERDSHKAMVIGEGGEKLKRIGTEPARSWSGCSTPRCSAEFVKVRSGWADDEARVRSFGYE